MTDIRPTAKWANRMLRPLTSIYHRLEKHQENLSIIANAKSQTKNQTRNARDLSTHGSRSSAFRSSASRAGAGGGSSSDGEPDDPAWIPGKPEKRRIRHSYSSRGQHNRNRRRSRLSIRSPEVQRTLPGAIEIATPLITGKRAGRSLLEGSGQSARRRLFRDTSPGTDRESSEADEGRKTGRATCFGAATTTTGSRCYAVYNRPWKEALDRSGDSGLVDIVRLLDQLFLKFLHNTRMQPQQPARGARSLLSIAVRRLPEFIAAEQEMQDEEDEDNDEDMCDAYFTELEAHYAPGGNGWHPLREAVRAQGIYLVSEMLRNKCVTKLIACRLLEGCLNQQEYDALELLFSRFLGTLDDTYGYPASFDSILSSSWCDDPVQLLSTYYVRNPGCRAFVFEELAKLLGRRVIPPEWLVTSQWKRFVDAAIQSLSTEEDDSAAAAHLIEAVVLSAGSVHPAMEMDMPMVAARVNSKSADLSVRAKDTRASAMHAIELRRDHSPCPIPVQDALNNLTMSLITALCGMYLARTAALRVRGILGYLAFTLQREIESRVPSDEAELSTFHTLRRGSVLLGESLLRCGEESQRASETCRVEDGRERSSSSNSTSTLQQFYQVLSSRSEVIKELAVLARQVFRCSERVHHHHYRSKHDDHQSRASLAVRSKVMQLAEMSSNERRKHHQRHLSTFLGKVAAETAMQLAEATVDPDDHVWTGEVQEVVLFQEPLPAKPLMEDQVDGADDRQHEHEQVGLYRWEESIEEWVARTPVRGRTRIDFKPAVGVGLGSPSSSASTASARSASPGPSDASSMTSSAPSEPGSVPAKRKFSGEQEQEQEPEPWSKRLRSTVSGSPAVRTPAPAPTTNTPSSTTSNEIDSSSSSHPRPRSGAMRRRIAEDKRNTAVGSTIEVVITNRAEPGPGSVGMSEMSISENKQDQRIPRIEEEESEDELSLLC